jgi:AcrR family transcriptional regulator
MNIRQKLSPEDMRERIIAVAEEHFRRIGYGKTAVADIAAALGMSPANVYRFFPSKSAINNAICAKIMVEIDELAESVVARPAPAGQRFVALIRALHRYNKTKLTNEHRLYDMVEVAMAENWPAIDAHCNSMVRFIARLVEDGIARGEFRSVEPERFAQTAFEACAKVLHPTLIAHCADEDQEDQVARLTGLVLDALRR